MVNYSDFCIQNIVRCEYVIDCCKIKTSIFSRRQCRNHSRWRCCCYFYLSSASIPADLTHLTYINEINDDWLPFYRFRRGGTQTYIIVHRTFYFCERLVCKKWLTSAALQKLKPAFFLRVDISVLVIQLQWTSWNIQYISTVRILRLWLRTRRKKANLEIVDQRSRIGERVLGISSVF